MARRQARHRTAGRERLLLRLRRRDPVRARGPRQDRDRDAQDHQGGPAVLAPGGQRRRRPRRAPGRALQDRADRRSRAAPPRAADGAERRGRRRRADHLRQPAPRRRAGVEGPLPRPAPAHHQAHPGVQADAHRGGVLAWQREEQAAPAHLRHRLGEQGGPRRAPPPARGGREARPPQARARARPVLLPRGARPRPGRLPSQGRRDPAGDGGLRPAAAHRGGLLLRQHAPHLQGRAVPHLRAPARTTPTPCIPRWSSRARSTSSRR